MKKIKLAHIVLNLDVGGMEHLVVNLVSRFNRNVYDPLIICLTYPGQMAFDVKALGIEVIALHKPDRFDLNSFFKLAKVLRQKKIDIVHTHNTAAFLYGVVASKFAGINRIFHTEHGRIFPDKPRLMLAEKILSFWVTKIVTVSEDMKRCLMEYEKIPPGKIDVILNGVDACVYQKFSDDAIRTEKRRELGIQQTDFVIGNVARLADIKDHRTLMKAFSFVKARVLDSKLVLVGSGPLKTQLIQFAEELNIQEDVLFLGQHKRTCELFPLFDLFVLSSKNEGISMTILEAMACENCIIATKVGGNREIIQDQVNGILVSPGSPEELSEKIIQLIENPSLRQQYAGEGRKTVQRKFPIEKTLKAYERLYLKGKES